MKKLVGTLALAAIAASAFAQGTITIANQTGLVKQWTTSSDSTLISSAKGNAMVEVIAAAKGTALANPLFTVVAGGYLNANYTSLAGFLAANPGWAVANGTGNPGGLSVNGIFANGNATIANISPAAQADYIVIGWTGSSTTFDQALASGSAFLGQSAIATTATGDPVGPPVTLPVSLKSTFGAITLAPLAVVPEPSSFALAGLGAAALMIFRRRK